MDTVFSTDGVAGQALIDRLGQLGSVLDSEFVGLQIQPRLTGSPLDYSAGSFRTRDLDGLSVARFVSSPLRAYRTPRDIARTPRDDYLVVVHVHGAVRIAQDGRRSAMRPGDLALIDASRPYAVDLGGNGMFEHVVIRVPRARLTAGRPLAETATAVRLAADSDAGRVLAPYFATIADPEWKENALTSKFLHSGLELLGAAMEQSVGARAPSPQSVMLERVRRESQQRLSDADLSPADAAIACSISTRQLHRLFADRGTTFGAWVREQRLRGSYHDLIDASMTHTTIAEIAARWGYRSAAHFSRSFHDRYGVSPRDVRRGRGTSPAKPGAPPDLGAAPRQ